jgi:coenzyme F420-0:L-glutamate ligase / coenzyme F420-1:gamma-L-glutamate ligase
VTARLELIALDGIGEVEPGDDLAGLIAGALDASGLTLADADCVVVTQKVVSKAEGRLVELSSVEPSPMAIAWAERWNKDPRQVELVLRESAEVVRMAPGGLIVSRTRHGFVCANAGVDVSNVGGGEVASLLPVDPDASARAIRDGLKARTSAAPAVIVSDSFGRPWRNGIVNVAVGSAGIEAVRDLRGDPDAAGRVMQATVIAVADELASAADLAGGKVEQRPVVLVRGYAWRPSEAGATVLVMDRERDLFP